ncbi:MAG TPA: S26 family signal peptidase [Candidatus Dormibacteraeota bacterium]|nr:S26 family signal peptidase [Candidatus Dormibacteraeota bacterium]
MISIGIKRIVGDSMSPYLNNRDLIVVLKTNKYKVGNVVGFKLNDKILIKRISKIKQNLFYVLGDNPSNSLDSRKLGWINRDDIVFKIFFKI